MTNESFNEEQEFEQYYNLQNSLREKVIKEDQLPETIHYIAGVDVAYSDNSDKMIGAIVVLDAQTQEIVEEAFHEMEITFPYIPGLFSFREIPPLIEAFKKLTIKPDIIVCDAQGIAHPKGLGMATHLGIELNIPTIGCAKKRLVGSYDKSALGLKRGAIQDLIYNDILVGKTLRTQDNTNPVFVSIGHKIALETAIDWVLKLTPNYRLPETTRQADHLVNSLLKKQ
jgi:deoxyribonuclease V